MFSGIRKRIEVLTNLSVECNLALYGPGLFWNRWQDPREAE